MNAASLAPWLGQKMDMVFSVIGYAMAGGVKRFSHRADDSVLLAVLPKPMELSRVPSSSTKLTGAFGSDGLEGMLDPALPEAASRLLVLADLWISVALPGLPL